jgi:uncharacterized protein with HEPN domain
MDAVLYQLVVLGEAANAALQADPSRRTRFPDVPWSRATSSAARPPDSSIPT